MGARKTITKDQRLEAPTAVDRNWTPLKQPSFAPARAGALDYRRCPSVSAGIARPYWAERLI